MPGLGVLWVWNRFGVEARIDDFALGLRQKFCLFFDKQADLRSGGSLLSFV